MLVYKLRMSIPSQQDAKIIEPGHHTLQLDPIDEKDRQRRFVLADVIEKGVLQVLCAFGRHCPCSVMRPQACRPSDAAGHRIFVAGSLNPRELVAICIRWYAGPARKPHLTRTAPPSRLCS